ncbi:hypothetical protein Q5O89_16910 [Peribacillus frigoritolerans]|nr:hypothetical protein [Peribacillus frigoritolerans]
MLGNNTNFSGFTFDGAEVYAGGGSFYTATQNATKFNDELIPVDVSKKYKFSLMAKSKTGLGKNYFGVATYDIDKNVIVPYSFYGSQYPITTLATDLKVGDTVINLTSSTGFMDDSATPDHRHSIVFWGYKNSFGYTYPDGTYSRKYFSTAWNVGAINRTTHTITLSRPFDIVNPNDPEGIWRAGHKVSPTSSGGNYQYMTAGNVNVPTTWTPYEGIITGNGISANAFPHGTAFVKLLFLTNRDTSGGQAGDATWFSSLSFSDVTAIKDIQTTLDNMVSDGLIDLKERQITKDLLTDIIGYVIGDTTTSLPTTATLDGSLKGSFYNVRKSAVNAGITTGDTRYVAVKTQYDALKTYLESLTPIDVWDVSTANRNQIIAVTKSTYRDKWLQYNLAVEALKVATTEQLKKNADNIQVGGRNLVRNSTFNRMTEALTLFDWGTMGSFGVVDAEADKPNSSILKISKTGNTQDWNYQMWSNAIQVDANGVKEFTLSFDVKTTSVAGVDSGKHVFFIRTFDDPTKTASADSSYTKGITSTDVVMVDNVWSRYTITIKPSAGKYIKVTPYLARNGEVFWREIQLEYGNKATDYKSAPEDSNEQIYLLENRVANAEQVYLNGGIVTTVMESTDFTEIMKQKADTDALSGLVNEESLDLALQEAQKIVDDKINLIDFAPYALSTDVQQTKTDLTTAIKAGGGVNIVRNSIGFANTDFWTITGTVKTTQDDSVKQLGFGSGWYAPVGTGGTISQTINTLEGQSYTISFYMKKIIDNASNGWAGVDLVDENNAKVTFMGLGAGEGTTNGYERYVYTFKATANTYVIRPTLGANADAVITGLMVNIGYEPLQWTMATGELYNTNIKMDMNGITVNQILNGIEVGRTKMTPTKFAGYYDVDNSGSIDESTGSVDEVFRMDKDEFVMKKATVKQEITMGTLKAIDIQSTAFTGWVWVSNKTE